MASRRRTVDLLPQIFRTETNQQFLAATLDQLTQEPSLVKTQGYVGRRVGPGVNPADNYVVEPTASRSDYQLEPGVVFFKPETTTPEDAITHPGMIDALDLQGANTTRQDRLFQSQYYVWDPFCDLDKFTNYSQYYWLPEGPEAVDVNATDVPLTDNWNVTRTNSGYQLSGEAGNNPTITLVRGGSYTFQISQGGGARFWIQSNPGVDGRLPSAPNISSRDVLGVINNGADAGTITFNVPSKTAQDFFYTLVPIGVIPGRAPNTAGTVDLITDLKFNEINNVYVDEFLRLNPLGIDGITNLKDRTLVFTNRIADSQDGGWQINTQFDPLLKSPTNNGRPGSFDTTTFDETIDIVDPNTRYGVWQIRYINDDTGNPYMRLDPVLSVNLLEKWRVLFGNQWSNTQWYRNASGFPEKIPLLTAALDELWYQDSLNPELFGRIRLVDSAGLNPVRIDEIIGAKNYTSPNGVVFTNGLKVQFRGFTEPAEFQDQEYYVEGVGTGFGVDARVGFVDGEAYFGPWHLFDNQRLTGAIHSETEFQQYIYDTVAESLANRGAGYPENAPLPSEGVLGATSGNGIRLIPVRELVTPETYTESLSEPYDSLPYDFGNYDGTLNAPLVPDYITINRASRDRNAWSRSNRWFHVDVIRYAAELNNTIPVFDNSQRGKRPIIEFRPDLRLFNFGTEAKLPVNIIDFAATDAFSNINGQLGYSIDGYTFIDGSRVIFAGDRDPDVRNRVYEVSFIDPDGDPGSAKIINLTPIFDARALIDQTVVCLSGNTQQGKSYWFNGSDWVLAQQKIGVNQAPLFDVYDANGISFSDLSVYPSSTFAGSRLFGYAAGGTGRSDDVLGFALKYLNINNVGDIVFENYLYTDTFLYVRNSVSSQESIGTGFVRQYLDRTLFSREIGWQDSIVENRSRQVFRFIYDGSPLILDVPVDLDSPSAPVQIFQGTEYINPDQYTTEVNGNNTIITLNGGANIGTVLEVQVISDQASAVAFYQVPLNLENNPLNENSNSFTLGTIRAQYETIGQNLSDIQGPIIGANNTRDLGNILRYGTKIVQNSAPLALAGPFLRDRRYEVIDALRFNSQEYEKFKALLMDLASQGDFISNTPTQILDAVLAEIALGKTNQSPFYWGDMLPAGQNYSSTFYTVSLISTDTFDTRQTYDYDASNYLGLNVYVNGTIQIRGYDYIANSGSRTVTFLRDLVVGDQIEFREFSATYGTYVPNTPSKMGLYPKFCPAIYIDEAYVNPTQVIRGHDGSITVAFGDFRDQVLLEFEIRVFNNIKISTPVPISAAEVIPGQFRETDYTLAEINEILSSDFLTWAGWNKLDYAPQTYLPNDPITYNYGQSSNKLNGQPLLGAWRGIYNYFYDTITPNTTPWEMLGFSERPDWWENYYGPAPYTSGNLVLWEDLSQGRVRDPNGEYFLPQYARPGLTDVIPSDSEGELLAPIDSTVGNYDGTSFRRSWVFGDDGPVENVWRTSSSWPFAVMRLLALTKPAKFFSLFADRDRYVYQPDLAQYLWDGRYRLDAKQLSPIYGNGVSKASYINWIIDYNRQLGVNSTQGLTDKLSNIGIHLCWRLAGFSDKKYLRLYTERSTPNSSNAGLLLPDESYQLLLYKNQPFEEITYSSVIVQLTDTGWQVFGYSTAEPYFEILTSRPNGTTIVIEAGQGADSTAVRIATEHSDNVTQIPYGYTFKNRTAVCDFLYSYGLLLERQGFVFENQENGYVLNWLQMCQEFLYWSNQGWSPGAIINLNPGATRISVSRPQAVVDSLADPRPKNLILNQNRQAIPPGQLVLERLGNVFRATSFNQNTINYLNVSFTAYEHMVVLDNRSIFNDLIYDPRTGARQSRILVSGVISGDWDGTVNAPGFVLNQDNIQEWIPNQAYAKGEIVLFKGEYWSASTIIQPSREFNYTLWIKSDYDEIQKGLLPNASNASDELASAYSVYNASLQNETDLFSYGLIGFRPRDYMTALNLDDVSQVQLYQQFLGSKGTVRAAEIFSFANLGKEIAEYNIYEYWALLRGSYGATANRNYFELLLDAAKLRSDPSLVQIVLPQETSQADQLILLENIYKTSDPLITTDILPTVMSLVSDTGLPTAGYVNLEDVDFTVFDLEDFGTTQNTLNQSVTEIGVGSTIWAAKVNNHDWGVFRVETVPGDIILVSDNLDGRSLVEFTVPHGLNVNDILIIRFFNDAVNGTYRVLSVPSLNQVLIDYSFVGRQTSIVGTGVGFTLQNARVSQASDIVNLPYSKSLLPGDRAWVDNNNNGQWMVLQKQQPFSARQDAPLATPVTGSQYGTSITQSVNNLAALVGAPGYGIGGAVYTYIKDTTNQYAENIILELGTTGAAGYGNAADWGDQTWAVVGASASRSSQGYAVVINHPPSSNVFTQYQLLVDSTGSAADEFGHSVAISRDERWIYVGAPGANRVYGYGLIEVALQSIEYQSNGSTLIYSFNGSIEINNVEQLAVIVNGIPQTRITDYNVDLTNKQITFVSAPAAGAEIIMARRIDKLIPSTGAFTYSVIDIYGADSTTSLAVYVNDVLQRPGIDYTLVGTTLTFVSPPSAGVQIRVRTGSYYRKVFEINGSTPGLPALDSGARFGHSVTTTTDGRLIAVGAPGQGSQGRVFIFDRAVKRFQVGTTLFPVGTTEFPTQESLNLSPINVTLNGQFLVNNQGNVNGDYTVNDDSSNTVVLNNAPAAGDIVEVETNQISFVQEIQANIPSAGAEFGSSLDQCASNCSLYIGSPRDSQNLIESGSVDYQINQARVYGSLTGVIQNPTLTPGDFLRVNNYYVKVTGTTVESLAQDIIDAVIPNVTAAVDNGKLMIFVKNQSTATPGNRLSVLPGTGSVFFDVGFEPLAWVQTFAAPVEQAYAHFGSSVYINETSQNLVIGAPDATAIESCTFDVYTLPQYLVAELGISGQIVQTNTYTGDGITDYFAYDINNSAGKIVVEVDGVVQNYIKGSTGSYYIDRNPRPWNSTTIYNIGDFIDFNGPIYRALQTVPAGFSPVDEINPLLPVYWASATFPQVYATDIAYVNFTAIPSAGSTINVYQISDSYLLNSNSPEDISSTTFDASSLNFLDPVPNSGAVYTFDLLSAVNPSITNPSKFVFGQQILPTNLAPYDRFGAAVNYTTGTLLCGAPGYNDDSSVTDSGRVVEFINQGRQPAWTITRIQKSVVDINCLNSVFMYDRFASSTKQYFDFIDPLQGRLLGAVRQNLDYIGAIDPAAYNVGSVNNYGQRWAEERVGEMWWDTANARFLDPNQDDIVYASRRWAQLFPGSTIDVYQWISSSVPPAQYTGPGQVRDTESYVSVTGVNDQGIIEPVYYFWVRGIRTVNRAARKTLGAETVARYIESPKSSGIAYIAPINASTVAIYNGLPYISAEDTVLHIEYDQTPNDDAVHVEYNLVTQNRADGFLIPTSYRKWLDSFSGYDTVGNPVPDPFLPESERYGINFRPRQSMFANRFLALQNYLQQANSVMKDLPIREIRSFPLLESSEPIPTSSSEEWNLQVANLAELSYQDLAIVPATSIQAVSWSGASSSTIQVSNPSVLQVGQLVIGENIPSNTFIGSISGNLVSLINSAGISVSTTGSSTTSQQITFQGYRYLVLNDSSNNGLWTIYEVQSGTLPGSKGLGLIRVQNYDTPKYWQYIDWYLPGYNPSTILVAEVPNYSALETITVPDGSSVKVTANAQGFWEIYRLTAGTWVRVALQSGTVEILPEIWDYSIGRFGFDVEVFDAQYFDQEPITETRRILQSLNEEIFIDDLAIERNRLLILTFNYILGEQIAPLWLTKTSLIDVDHVIRNLEPFQIYRLDNQDFVLNYIQEVKPYHTQIREFNLIYQGSDEYQGTVTDFDVPAYWNAQENLFVSPVLDDVGNLSTTSSTPSTSEIWQTLPWSQWYQNYLLGIESVTIVDGGSGYTVPPEVVITGECERPAVAIANINSAGRVSSIDVVDPGLGYRTTAIITLEGGNGIGARAVANMGNSLVRDIKTTIKYDRYQYRADFSEWQADTVYAIGDRVRYRDRVWQATESNSSSDFDPDTWQIVPAADLSGVDRTMGYYVPRDNEPGLDLALLITGVDYPGVQVYGPDFNQNTGFDVGNYDINPFDNISYGPEGRPTYDPAILDAIYESEFTDSYLGVLPAPAYDGDPPNGGPNPIVVDGGAFVDTYSSHAPEELVPGAIFDTLDLRVYTSPGADWQGNGHGFALQSVNYQVDSLPASYSFADLLPYPVTLRVFNITTGLEMTPLVNYTSDWINNTITVISGASVSDIISINVYGLGGGNQLYRGTYLGSDVGPLIQVPIQESLISDIAVFVNGSPVNNYTWESAGQYITNIIFSAPLTPQDLATVTVFGQPVNGITGWSTPITQYFVANGSMSYTLANDISGTNPANILVTINGRHSRPAEGIAYLGDGSTVTYGLPTRGGYDQSLIGNNEVAVYVDNRSLTLGVDFYLDPYDLSSDRTVTLTIAPPAGSKILISVSHAADYYISGTTLIWKPSASLIPLLGDTIAITTWNDTSEQDILTQVFVGPEVIGSQVNQGYETTLYDEGNVTGAPDSYDYGAGILIKINRFDTGRVIEDASRLLVSLNGIFLFAGDDFIVDGSSIKILGAPIDTTAVLAITSFTQSVVPNAMAFRIFQDMRGQQLTYRITPETTTELAQTLQPTDDTIYVVDASRLGDTNLEQGIFGQITIDGERITYRTRNLVNNTLSGLRRGVAGTGAAEHAIGAAVTDIGRGNLLPLEYQDTVISTPVDTSDPLDPNPYLGDGVNTTFVATDITVTGLGSTETQEAVRVSVGGTAVTSGYQLTSAAPVTVTFDEPPAEGSLVTIQVVRGLSWYQPGPGRPSDGAPLQETNTVAARFIRGD